MSSSSPSPLTKIDISGELNAIRNRLAVRRRELAPGGSTTLYTTTDLADAEWLLVELDKTQGFNGLTPAETHELAVLTEKRKLSVQDQAVLDRISGKHGENLTPEELVERDYLLMKQDAQVGPDGDKRFKELTDKANAQAPTPVPASPK